MTSRPPAIGGIGRGRPVNLAALAAQQSTPGGNQNFAVGNNGQAFGAGSNSFAQAAGFGRAGGFATAGGRNGSCSDCGQQGHFARECAASNSFGGGNKTGRRGCFKCGKHDHIARECPESQGHNSSGFGGGNDNFSGGSFSSADGFGNSGFGFGGGGSSGQGGFAGDGFGSGGGFGGVSNGYGDSLPPRGRGRGGGGRGRGCFNCGDLGHISRNCGKLDTGFSGTGAGAGGRSGKCYRCNGTGHLARDCTEPAEFERSKKPASKYVPEEASVDDLWKQHIPAGINFERSCKIPVEVTDPIRSDPLQPIESFSDAGLPPQLLTNVQKAGYVTPTPIQQYAIPCILAERDFMACAQTGSGKTAAFLLPILTAMMRSETAMDTTPGDQEPIAIVMAPTRELVDQIKDEARKFSAGTRAKVVALYGGTSVYEQKTTLRLGCNICVGAPGRLLHFVEEGLVRLSRCKYLVLDEADRMLDMGFEEKVRQLVQQSDMPPKTERQTLMFSATFPHAIQQLASEFLNDQVFITVGQIGAANLDIVQEIVLVKDPSEKKDLVLKFVLETMNAAKDASGKFHSKTIVFVQRKRMADYLVAELCTGDPDSDNSAVQATSLHSDREQRERELVFRQFKSGEFPVLVATDLAARGLDIQEVDHVINYDMPTDIDQYVHRIGRTARVGNVGRATSFFDPSSDMAIAKDLVKVLTDAQQNVPDWLLQVSRDGFYAPPDTGDSQDGAVGWS